MSTGLLLYSNCILVRGAGRSAICDLQRKYVYPIPHSMAALFTYDRYFDYPALLEDYPASVPVLNEYCDFLNDRELAFPCIPAEIQFFPELGREWIYPGQVTHCVLDTHSGTYPFFNGTFIQQLDSLGCRFLQFRFFCEATPGYLEQLMAVCNDSDIGSVELLLPTPGHPGRVQEMVQWVLGHPKISALVLHSAAENGLIHQGQNGIGYVVATKEVISNHKHCGRVDPSLFVVNIPAFMEALHHNSCLNRKLSIDANGFIRNCPSMPEHFGNVKDTALAEAVAQREFRKYWNITKDMIGKCKDCEFRYVCTDCRAHLENPEDEYSKPLKCGYDPYTCTWEDWSTHPLKQAAIDLYGLRSILQRSPEAGMDQGTI